MAKASIPADSGRVTAVALVASFCLAALLGILWFAVFNPITHFTPGIDSGVYLYIGQQMLKGAAPYRDVFDNKGPVLYLVNALGIALGRGSFWGVYAVEYCLLAGTTIVTWVVLRTRVGALTATVAAAFFVLEVVHIVTGNHEEEYGVVLQSVVLLLLARTPNLESRRWPWYVAGVLAGGAFFLKPTTLGLWIALIITVGVLCLSGGGWRYWGSRILVGVGGVATTGLAVLGYLAAAGALSAFAEDYLIFNTLYVSSHDVVDRLASIRYGIGSIGYLVSAVAVVAWLLTLRRVRRKGSPRRSPDVLALIAVVWLPVEIALSATSGFSWRQYYFPWVLPTTLLLAFSVSELLSLSRETSPERRSVLPSVAAAGIVVLAFAGLALPSANTLRDLAGTVRHHTQYRSQPSQTDRLAGYIRANSSPDDYVFVWGSHYAGLNMLAERRSPTRYAMQMALYNSDWATRGVPQLLADLKAHPPALILDSSPTRYAGSVPPIASGTNPRASDSPAVSATWASVYAYLREHYRRQGRVDFPPWWEVYVPREQ